mmetsp:Transcript_43591/g.72470  ORF Transcript_43591/g.72470 Transcript_43591/m.72470 type:complete len:294 (+) Transcript_43591:102-983(+)
MNALADAAFLSSSDPSAYGSTAYTEAELQAMGVQNMGMPPSSMAPMLGTSSIPPVLSSAVMNLPGRALMPTQQLPGPGRHLQILDHTVHRIDTHTKHNGEEEKEMVVSNLRHFTLKIGVLDPRTSVGRDAELPLKAELLYENGQLVEQLATCEPLLVGKTEVVSMQGSALFKLRITSLSSHRDKQRFRIRVSPTDTNMLLREPGLSVVTTPMKCVTKLSHRSCGAGKLEDGGVEDEDWDESANGGGMKRKRDDLEPLLEAQSQQLQQLQQSNQSILEQLQNLKQLLSAQLPST